MSTNCEYCKERPAIGSIRIAKWSGMGEDLDFSYCSQECRQEIEKAAERVRRGAPWFLGGMAVWVVLSIGLMVAVIVLNNYALMAPVVAAILIIGGAFLAVFPLVASNAVRMLGIRSAERYARGTGIVSMLVGVGFYFVLRLIMP